MEKLRDLFQTPTERKALEVLPSTRDVTYGLSFPSYPFTVFWFCRVLAKVAAHNLRTTLGNYAERSGQPPDSSLIYREEHRKQSFEGIARLPAKEVFKKLFPFF